MYLLYPQQAKNISRKSLIDLFYVLDNFFTKINTFINIFISSVSGSNPHIHNPGGDPVPGMPYNFIQSGLKKNWI